ncbi:MAG TPA: R3H domain-containing nucleic acid-binding protein [Candidatus Binatia bacterium]|nr:R3H domain-containing nucleic acid-binding protein [Candidatus Binatia bacterium]
MAATDSRPEEPAQVRIDDLGLLFVVLPERLRQPLESEDPSTLLEVILDLGRTPEARYTYGARSLGLEPVSREEIAHTISRIGSFGSDNRAGIEGTLHRIAALRNRRGEVVGLTCRVGRAVTGTINIVRDLFARGESVLLLGKPGVGKTTLLREAARVLADDLGKRVVIVDTSNEIAGDGDIPHPGIGKARRLQVPSSELQHSVMIEAVENHMPEVVVVDEIGTHAEALAARTIAERGVQLIATAHGTTLENLLSNPTLADLVGGVEAVTLGDEEARRRRSQKTVLERRASPTFDVLIEIQSHRRFAVCDNVAEAVDALLAGRPEPPEIRERREDGTVEIHSPTRAARPAVPSRREAPRRIFPYGVSYSRLERAIRALGVATAVTPHLKDADLVLTLRSQLRKAPPKLAEAQRRGLAVMTISSNTQAQIEELLSRLFAVEHSYEAARSEAERAVETVLAENRPVVLPPRPAPERRLQHMLAAERGLGSESRGREPFRSVTLYPVVGPRRPE